MEIHKRLKSAREAAGLTQQAVANSLFVARQTVSRWETGSREPSLKVLQDLAILYETSIAELIGQESVTERRINFFAILGNVVFDFLLIATIGLGTLLVLLIGWMISGCLVLGPLYAAYMWLFNIGELHFVLFSYRPQGVIEAFCYLLTFLVGLSAIYIMLSIHKLLYRMAKSYVKYTLKTIRYTTIKKN
ncbi:helix-turn-helix domain-containing protein [Liquorilactobacillus uvarum]|uniref:helix-turn-helix domain-containing protein n=1 Tax=Liquorilactobacillus uvarum TaxID=303240 RepID=UPI00288972E6|nr:helix-turn-helix transcriptional regulator [Liquorilactobacillus uvarum]